MLGDNLTENLVDLASHVRRITADVEVSLLQEELIDLGGALAQAVLDIDFLGAGAGKGGDYFKGVAEGGFVLLGISVSMLGVCVILGCQNLPPIPSRR